MTGFEVVLASATLLVALVAGFVFGFAVVAMPGIRDLEDRAFIRAFQVMDGVIQRNQPLFLLMWVGSVIATGAAMGLSVTRLAGVDQALVFLAGTIYMVGVQLPTAGINIPLNNQLQAIDTGSADDATISAAREVFENRWNRWNAIRTVFAVLSAGIFLAVLVRV